MNSAGNNLKVERGGGGRQFFFSQLCQQCKLPVHSNSSYTWRKEGRKEEEEESASTCVVCFRSSENEEEPNLEHSQNQFVELFFFFDSLEKFLQSSSHDSRRS